LLGGDGVGRAARVENAGDGAQALMQNVAAQQNLAAKIRRGCCE